MHCTACSLPTLLSFSMLVVQAINLKIRDFIRNNKATLSSASLRNSLRDDVRLLSDATVTSIESHGRWYISASISPRSEMPLESPIRRAAAPAGTSTTSDPKKIILDHCFKLNSTRRPPRWWSCLETLFLWQPKKAMAILSPT